MARSVAQIVGGVRGGPALRVRGDGSAAVSDLTVDSREVGPGSLFCCVRGEHRDGHEYASAAVDAGAAALLTDHELPLPVEQVLADDTRVAAGWLAASVFDHPSDALTTFGITGTNGKTTTAHLIGDVLRGVGRAAEVFGTLTGAHTTPEAPDVQRRLASCRDRGVDAVVMEVSSHALALHRIDGTTFDVAVFTNLGRDHLDLHATEERYFAAKARLFTSELSSLGVVNVDDVRGRLLLDAAEIPTVPFSLTDARDVRVSATAHSYTWRGHPVRVAIGGHFNVMNSLAAATACSAAGIDPADIATALGDARPVPGRFEAVDAGQPFAVVVDYAHTPDGLRAALAAARAAAPGGRLIVVFGCGGDRDVEKRPLMGAAAAELADSVVVTSDNPRSEPPQAIIDATVSGIAPDYRAHVVTEPDRRAAIALALAMATPGDVVLIAGKGHETTQTIGDRVVDFDDRRVARELLEARVIAVMIAAATAMVIALFGTRFLIVFFRNRGKGQPILGKEDRGPEHHIHKQGTPTMGGLAVVGAAFIGWSVAHVREGLPFSTQAMIMWAGILVMSFMGFLDDYIKVMKAHNRGIFWKKKSWITYGLALATAAWLVMSTGISETISFTRATFPGWDVNGVVWIIWAGTIIWSTTNAVNVTDGLDGLAGGSAAMGFLAFTIIAYWAFRNDDIYGAVVNPLDLAALAAAFGGACVGFLWYNAAPARIIMGDVGALGIGAALALLALGTNTHLLLLLICGINVMEAGSVAVQMGVFKASGRKKRLFRMSPIHHHFELVGWPETTVIIRFWLICGICIASALAIFIADFTRLEDLR